ncbi:MULTISPECIES: mechanosensitive ion channel family protein [Pseudorhizobium]|uniref:Small-conductance mechanosensitive channel n=1 Tax=Pseudorhizobium pelagicum TaxID=1509405 RepID=A0A922NY05_9HYPH|nr:MULTISPECIES: mechanosensitive ion channel domain-containing protein [Pseudorhizobium]KEQ04704.1 mechanosensitive ion channel protein [Pseudorhizobium pelagicum]KEQ06932.1 mechanosensitive ion channel protein [Pseudorhizobium pelagicum]|tara:strand:- start:1738 stop:2634 length:897 start_codon:yes stop_codon:yes gene_type:complete
MEQASDIVVASRAALAQLAALAVQYSFSIVGALLLLFVGWIASGMLSRWAFRGLSRIHGIDVTLAHFFSNVIRYAVLVLVFVMVLGQFGVQTASILAALGAIGLAIGLALQGTLQNIAAGIMLLVLRPFRVGEYIDTGNINGIVQDIGLFATELKTYDGLYRLAPNSLLWNVPVTNYSRLATRMHDFKVGIAYEDDIDKALAIMLDIVRKDDRVLDTPEPSAFVMDLGDNSVVLALRYWANSSVWWMTSRDITKAVKEAFDSQGITIPYPQVTYHAPPGDSGPPALLQMSDEPDSART